jgi:hypothetical protein
MVKLTLRSMLVLGILAVAVPAAALTRRSPDPHDAAANPVYVTTPDTVSSESGFDWGDAVVGAAAGITLLVMLALLVLATLRRLEHLRFNPRGKR